MTHKPNPPSQSERCPQCGSRLLFGTSQSHPCPVCLMKLGLENDVYSGSFAPAETTASDREFIVPEIAQLQRYFPHFEFIRLLGKGGMGAVYEAKQTTLDRIVAVKIIHPAAAADMNFAERFQREARSLARLSHPNIVTVHDFGEVNIAGDGGAVSKLYFIVMEHVDGCNLRELIRTKQLTPTDALRIVPAICDALQYAHDSGIVHRDIKPENILVDRSGRVKIADFGLVKLIGRQQSDTALTGEYQAMGTMHYMAPEQFEKPLEVDHRADIYALGVTLYELLTGELPLGRFLPPSQRVHVDVRLDEIVLKSMDREPSRRYQHVSEVKTDVENVSSAQDSAQQPEPYLSATPIEVNPFIPRAAAFIGGGSLLMLVMKHIVFDDARTWTWAYTLAASVLMSVLNTVRQWSFATVKTILGAMLAASFVVLITMRWLVDHLSIPLQLGTPGDDEAMFLRVGVGLLIIWIAMELAELHIKFHSPGQFSPSSNQRSPLLRWVAAIWLDLPSFLRLILHILLAFAILACGLQFLGFKLDPSGGEIHFRFGGPKPWLAIDMTQTRMSSQFQVTLSALLGLVAFGLMRLDNWLTALENKPCTSELWLGFIVGFFMVVIVGVSSIGLGMNATLSPPGSPISMLYQRAQTFACGIALGGFVLMIGCLWRIYFNAQKRAARE
jgi:serine/threonine protein kinase